jgi:hypothetical protein
MLYLRTGQCSGQFGSARPDANGTGQISWPAWQRPRRLPLLRHWPLPVTAPELSPSMPPLRFAARAVQPPRPRPARPPGRKGPQAGFPLPEAVFLPATQLSRLPAEPRLTRPQVRDRPAPRQVLLRRMLLRQVLLRRAAEQEMPSRQAMPPRALLQAGTLQGLQLQQMQPRRQRLRALPRVPRLLRQELLR